jgi:hypothetical protein
MMQKKVEKNTSLARLFGCSREYVRQVKERFNHNLDLVLNTLPNRRSVSWAIWESEGELTTALSHLRLEVVRLCALNHEKRNCKDKESPVPDRD